MSAYYRGFGQLVNRNKSAIFFSKNCSVEGKEEIRRELYIASEALEEKYLGLPTMLGMVLLLSLRKINAQVNSVVNGGSVKKLSGAGQEVYVKSVARAIPTFSMSCFLLSKTTCKKTIVAMARFWWGGDVEHRKMHWWKWSEIALPKCQRGMGFRDLRQFNVAMIGKQGWRLLTNPNSLCAQVLKGKYFHDSDFLSDRKKRNCSHTWGAILKGRTALEMGLIRRIGDGVSTKYLADS